MVGKGGLGKMDGEYTIQLKEDAVPFALTTPHRVAIPLMDSVNAALQRMEKLGVISRIEEPTDWCTGRVVVPNPNKHVRICVDLTKLNENVRRGRHQLPAVGWLRLQGLTSFQSLMQTQHSGRYVCQQNLPLSPSL